MEEPTGEEAGGGKQNRSPEFKVAENPDANCGLLQAQQAPQTALKASLSDAKIPPSKMSHFHFQKSFISE